MDKNRNKDYQIFDIEVKIYFYWIRNNILYEIVFTIICVFI